MPTNVLQNMIDSGLQFTEVQRRQAEKVVRELVKSGEIRRAEAAKTVENLIERGRETSMMIAEVVRAEVARQLDWLGSRVDGLEDQLEAVVSRFSGGGGRSATVPATTTATAASVAPAKAAATKRAPARKAVAKKSPPRKAAKKSPATKSAVKKTPARKKSAARKSHAETGGAPGRRPPASRSGPDQLTGCDVIRMPSGSSQT